MSTTTSNAAINKSFHINSNKTKPIQKIPRWKISEFYKQTKKKVKTFEGEGCSGG